MADAPFADQGFIDNWHQPGEPNFDSEDNVYLEIIQTFLQHSYKEGAYGAGWGAVSFPSSPVDGLTIIRYNTDTSTKRSYTFDTNNGWETNGDMT